jgi:membrane protein
MFVSGLIDRLRRTSSKEKVPLTEGRLSWPRLAKRAWKEASNDHVAAFAGSLTYQTLLALFPFAIFVLSVLFVAGQESLLLDAVGSLREAHALSPGAAHVITGQVEALSEGRDGALGLGVAVSVLVALWATSGAFRSVMEATNVMYGVKETRGFVRRYATSLILSVVVAVLFVVALALVVAGPSIAAKLGETGEILWLVLQWPALIAFVLLALALLYYYAPSAEQEFRFITPGAVFATAAWLAFSLAFSAYVNNFGSYNRTYGALAGVVVTMLYSYWSAFIFLFGAQINQVIEEASPEGKDEGDKRA